jgi:pyruvate carboxylase subunit B
VLPELGNVKLASNREEELLLELLPSVANGFLRKRRTEEFNAAQAAAAPAEVAEEKKAAEEPITGETVSAPMGGRIISVNVKPGQQVKAGEVILVYEAMKMENDVTAPKAATIKRIFVVPDQVVNADEVMVEFE